MKARSVQVETLGASLMLAAAAVLAAAALGYAVVGAGVAVGLVAGSLNGFAMRTLLERRAPILPTSFLRLAFFSLLALVVARLAGLSAWAVVGGIVAAQLVTVGFAVRQGLRS